MILRVRLEEDIFTFMIEKQYFTNIVRCIVKRYVLRYLVWPLSVVFKPAFLVIFTNI